MFTYDSMLFGTLLFVGFLFALLVVIFIFLTKEEKKEKARILSNFKMETQSDIRVQAVRIYVQNPRFNIPSGNYEDDLVKVVKMMQYNFNDPKWLSGEGLLVARSILDERYRTAGNYIV